MTKNVIPRILIIRGMTFEFEYLGEFEFIFKSILGLKSGDQRLTFYEKNRSPKSRASVPLNGCLDTWLKFKQKRSDRVTW